MFGVKQTITLEAGWLKQRRDRFIEWCLDLGFDSSDKGPEYLEVPDSSKEQGNQHSQEVRLRKKAKVRSL